MLPNRVIHAVRCCWVAFLIMAPTLHAARPYTPSLGDPVGQTACWRGVPGLEGVHVRCACETPDGSILLGTQNSGMLLYDGMRIQKLGLADAEVLSLAIRSSVIYVGTENGLSAYKDGGWSRVIVGKRVTRIRVIGNDVCVITPNSLVLRPELTVSRGEGFQPIDFVDAGNALWVLEMSGKISAYHDSKWTALPDCPNLPPGSGSFTRDGKGGIWLLHESRKLVHWPKAGRGCDVMEAAIGNGVLRPSAFTVTADGNVWVGTSYGLAVLRKSGWYLYQSRGTLAPPGLNGIMEAKSGLWMFGNEVRRLDHMGRRQEFFFALALQAESADGTQWFVRQNIGSEVVRRRGDTWTLFNTTDGLMDDPRAIFVTRNDEVWAIGVHREQAAVARLRDGRWDLHLSPEFRGSFDRARIYEEEGGDIYILAIGQRGWPKRNWQALVVHPIDEDVEWSRPDADRDSTSILPGNEIWLKAPSLLKLSEKTRKAFLQNKILSETIVNTIHGGTGGMIWAGTDGSGLLQFDGVEWKRFDTSDGLPSSQIHGVFELADGSVIAGALESGFSRRSRSMSSWSRNALLPRFDAARTGGREHAIYQTYDGAVWLITKRGTLCHRFEQAPPDTLLIGKPRLTVEQSDLVVAWRGIDRWNETRPEQLLFSYRLDNGKWSPFTDAHQQILSGLEAGEHSFEIRARDRDLNVDATPAVLRLQVQLPMWQRPWFLALMGVMLSVIIALIVLLIRARMRRIVELERLRAAREQELNEVKLRFFVNVSHEFRTPLTLILGPLERMLTKGEIDSKQGSMIHRNAKRLLKLVNELLDFRQLESGQLQISPELTDLSAFAQDFVRAFQDQADSKKIEMKLDCPETALLVEFDRDKMEKILTNLLSNAMKFTRANGRIDIEVRDVGDSVTIRVSDTGCGIPAKDLPHIFDRFFQSSRGAGATGTGIGLALTRELVELHNGTIEVESIEGQSTSFTVALPKTTTATPQPSPDESLPETEITVHKPAENVDDTEAPLVLIVEDNDDMREFLHSGLTEHYQVVEAEDGVEGWDVAKARMPELIVSDVMMPRMDGLDLARKLRDEPLTSHIPIIMLTARASEEHEIEGLQCGVDDYIQKPFSMPVLKARIDNLLDNRKRLFELFRVSPEDSVNVITENPLDREFLERATSIVEENMEDTEFGTAALVAQMHMDRTTLHRKLKGLTSQSTSVFIRSIRLKRAASLLRAGSAVSDAAYGVGIENLSYFSKCFREQFGVPPADYKKGNTD